MLDNRCSVDCVSVFFLAEATLAIVFILKVWTVESGKDHEDRQQWTRKAWFCEAKQMNGPFAAQLGRLRMQSKAAHWSILSAQKKTNWQLDYPARRVSIILELYPNSAEKDGVL